MIKKVITYTDYNGNEKTKAYFFNLNQAEIVELENSIPGGLTNMIERLSTEQDNREIIKIFKDLILRSYGEKSPDGDRFVKNDELREGFSQTEAYNELFMELAQDSDAAAEFFNGVIKGAVNKKPPINIT